ncbi:hypothetical protein N9972_00170 [bacterium]|nr:hypothetical protein [bacterium]
MAQIDYAGLLTGISSQNQRPSPFTSPSRDQQLLGFAAKQNEALTGRLGGMFGQQQQDPVELAKTKLVGLDPTNPADQPQFIQLLNIVDPGKAAQFKQQLDAQKKTDTANKAKADRVVNIRNAVVTRIETDPRYADILPVIQQGLFDDNPEELIKLLKRDTVEGIKLGKPFAGKTPTGDPLMLVIKSQKGQDDVIVDLAGVAPPPGTILSTDDGTKVEVNLTGETEDAFSKALGKGLADDLIESRNKAATSVLTGSVLNNQWKLIDEGLGILSGTGTNVLLGVGKVLSAAGVLSGEGAELIANTEAFLGNAGNLVAEAITAFGAGTGLSDADRDFAKQIVAGDPAAFTEEGIRRILKLQAHIVKFKVEQHNKKVANSPAASSVYDMSVPVPSFPWAESERATSDVDAQTQALIDKYTKGKK